MAANDSLERGLKPRKAGLVAAIMYVLRSTSKLIAFRNGAQTEFVLIYGVLPLVPVSNNRGLCQ